MIQVFIAIIAAGTWRYIIFTVEPCLKSSAVKKNPQIRPANKQLVDSIATNGRIRPDRAINFTGFAYFHSDMWLLLAFFFEAANGHPVTGFSLSIWLCAFTPNVCEGRDVYMNLAQYLLSLITTC